jgi:uncharacterized protein YbjT (DUF2867 family)
VRVLLDQGTPTPTLSRHEGDSIQTVDAEGQLALVEAAKSAGAEYYVFVSFRDNPSLQYPLTQAKRAVERSLKASGIAYTMLRAAVEPAGSSRRDARSHVHRLRRGRIWHARSSDALQRSQDPGPW